ncbi:MAG: HDOD domain-containing protein [Phycisphaeraceae bacterium]|nr:HDOD domain-containing protein [Phycisphaeraceae bacterium]
MSFAAPTTPSHRLELVLRQIQNLPTLPAIAAALWQRAGEDHGDLRRMVELIEIDPVLTAGVLSLRRHVELGPRLDSLGVLSAATRLGFDAVRNMALSVRVIDGLPGVVEPASPRRFNHMAFWRHCLASAIAAQRLASALAIDPQNAYVAGLLHDLGKIALDHIVPKSMDRAMERAELQVSPLAPHARQILGMDHHTAGKRLSEQWRLPHVIQDCIWLYGSPYDSLPPLEHQAMVGVVKLANLLARAAMPGAGGDFASSDHAAELARRLGLSADALEQAGDGLAREVEDRWRRLGLLEPLTSDQYVAAMQRARDLLGQCNAGLQTQARTSQRQGQTLESITAFLAGATPGRNVQDVMNAVASSAASTLGPGFYAAVYPVDGGAGSRQWVICEYASDQLAPVRSELIDAPPHLPDLTELDPGGPPSTAMLSLVPWLVDYLAGAPDVREVQWLPLSCGWGTAALLLHDRAALPPRAQLQALTSTWGSAIAAAAQHDGARRMGERLAEANLALAEAQDRLLHAESMARLGQLAAGAAHEMNNPLAVICGRAQLLARSLPADDPNARHAQTIADQSHRLSDLITLLKLFAEPPTPRPVQTDVAAMLRDAVDIARAAAQPPRPDADIRVQVDPGMSPVMIDGDQTSLAVADLVRNALEASPASSVKIVAQLSDAGRALKLEVSDNGPGMDRHTLAHAMDPFFSVKPAGRRTGMGLPRAQQLVVHQGGTIALHSTPGQGTRAMLWFPLDSAALHADT